jgi:transposase
MQRLQAYKYELMPNGEQRRNMRRFAGSCRFVFNKALALQKENHEAGNKFIGYVAMAKLLTGWRNGVDTPWLKDVPCHPLQHALKDLEKAYKNFFAKRAEFPRFKRKGSGDNFRYPDPKQIKLDQANSRLFLPKLGWLRYRNSWDVLGELRNVTVSQSGSKWFVSIQTQREVEQPVHPATSIVGIDVCIEDLQVRNMSRSAAGSAEQPGKNVRVKSGLNKSILDQGWFEFRRQLEYKQAWLGGEVLAVPPRNTSRTCPACGHVSAENRPTQARFSCVECGYENNADLVGAINVLERGHRLLACGELAQSGRSVKQEPTEVSQLAFS